MDNLKFNMKGSIFCQYQHDNTPISTSLAPGKRCSLFPGDFKGLSEKTIMINNILPSVVLMIGLPIFLMNKRGHF